MSGFVCSMTGFAAVEAELSGGRACMLTVKSVNHRHLDLSVRLPNGLEALELALRELVKARVRRGHVELTLAVEKAQPGPVEVDEVLLAGYVEAFRRAARTLGLAAEPDLNALLRLPGVLAAIPMSQLLSEAATPALLTAAGLLLDRFNQARQAEGAVLAAELRVGMERLSVIAQEASVLRKGIAAAEFARLKARLGDLLAGGAADDRLLTEAALIAARTDIEEELVRLRTHIARFTELLGQGGEIGRALDFLLQEMNREANTALSKSGSAGEAGLRLTDLGLAAKVELERAREQVQNLE